MANKPFQIIDGGLSKAPGVGARWTSGSAVGAETGVYAPDGTQYYKGPPKQPPTGNEGDGGDGSMRFTLPDLRWNVAILNSLALLFTATLVGMFLWLVDRIDDKFDDVMKPMQEVQKDVAAQGATLVAIDDKLDRLMDKQEDNNAKPTVESGSQGKPAD